MKPLHSCYLALSTMVVLSLVLIAQPKPARGGRTPLFCGTYSPTLAEAQRMEFLNQKALIGKGSLNSLGPITNRGGGSVKVDVYFHVITTDDGSQGNLTQKQIDDQMAELNKAFAGQHKPPAGVKALGPAANTPFRFVLKGVDRTASTSWFYDDNTFAMKSALRVGNAATLNIYTCSIVGKGLLGYAVFPQWYRSDPVGDGIVIDISSFPGQPGANGLGRVLAHEVGHWAGLYHTFQGGCEKYNDFVNDTAAEAGPFGGDWFTGGFPGTIPDTCNVKNRFPGLDPVDNEMDYSADASRIRFTKDQSARMDTLCLIYRGL